MTETEIQKILDSQRDFFRSGSTLDVKGRQESLARLKKGFSNTREKFTKPWKRIWERADLRAICARQGWF